MKNNPFVVKNIFFNSLLLLGLVYLSFLIVFICQTFSGFVMQFIFFFDSPNVIFKTDFIINFFSGLASLTLLFFFVKSVFIVFVKVSSTQKYLRTLKTITRSDYLVFQSPVPHAFTAGILNPKIYISSQLLKISSPQELKAVYYHEYFHKISYDPFKDLYVSLLSHALPFLPFKDWFFGQYHLAKENSCDFFSEGKIDNKTPLISALFKIHSSIVPKMTFLNHFSAQSERIKILTGKKRYHFINPFGYSIFSVLFLILSINFLSQSDIFYHCQHLEKCLEIFISGQNHSMPSCH